jgi:hypothetical protein
MAEAHQFECASYGYEAMVNERGSVMRDAVQTVAYRSFEKLHDVPVFDVHRPAPGHREPSCPCPKPKGHEIEAWEPPGLCPRCGEGTMERAPLAATVD